MKHRPHLNSLGYAIGGDRRAMIVWGLDQDGNRVAIEMANRGSAQRLKCECGALLVAKKGDINAHHFAHKANSARFCEVATDSAVSHFISDTLLDAGSVMLPMTRGKIGEAKVFAVRVAEVEGLMIHVVDAQRDRRLAILTRTKRQSIEQFKPWCNASTISGMLLDLRQFRNESDDDLRHAILRAAPREWIVYRGPSPPREPSQPCEPRESDTLSPREIMRRLFGM